MLDYDCDTGEGAAQARPSSQITETGSDVQSDGSLNIARGWLGCREAIQAPNLSQHEAKIFGLGFRRKQPVFPPLRRIEPPARTMCRSRDDYSRDDYREELRFQQVLPNTLKLSPVHATR